MALGDLGRGEAQRGLGDRVGDGPKLRVVVRGEADAFEARAALGHEVRRGSGIDPYTEEGVVSLGPYVSAKWSSALNGLTKLLVSKGALFIGTSTGLIYYYTSGAPTLIYTTGKAGGIISFARAFGDAAYAGTGTDGVVFSGNTSVWVSAFTLSGTVTGVGAMAQHWKDGLPQLYMAAENSGGRCTLHTSDGATSAAYSAAVLEEPLCRVMIPYKRDLVVVGVDTASRRSSIYQIDDSGAFASGFEQKLAVEGAVILCGAVLGDYLYLGDKYSGRIWRWDGDRLKLFHQLAAPGSPYSAEIRGMVAYQGALWVSIVDTDGTIGLLRFDGNQSWSRPVTGLTGTTPEDIAAMPQSHTGRFLSKLLAPHAPEKPSAAKPSATKAPTAKKSTRKKPAA